MWELFSSGDRPHTHKTSKQASLTAALGYIHFTMCACVLEFMRACSMTCMGYHFTMCA